MQEALPLVLILTLGFGAIALVLDRRMRRIERQVSIAMPTRAQEEMRSIRRSQTGARWRPLYGLVGFRPGLAYPKGWKLVPAAGLLAAGAVFYVNRFFGLPPPVILLAAAAAALVLMRALFGWLARRLAGQLFRQLPDAIELVLSTVRAGLPVSEAFRVVAREMPQPSAGQFALVCNDIALGQAPEDALEAVCDRTGVPEYAIFAVALAIQTKSGGRLSETLQTLGDTIRGRVTMAGRAKAMAGEVIFSSRALTISPVLVGGLLYSASPRSVDLLFTDPTGRMLLAYAVVSVILGAAVIQWMVNKGTAL